MANLTPKLMYQGNSTGSSVYSVANTVGLYSIIKSINICNTSSASNATASIHILVDGASAAADNAIIKDALIIKNDVMYYNTSVVLPANSALYVSSSASDITFTISGVEYA